MELSYGAILIITDLDFDLDHDLDHDLDLDLDFDLNCRSEL